MTQEGSLDITIDEEGADGEPVSYAVTFTPFSGEGEAVPARVCEGEKGLTDFLGEAGIQHDIQVDALKQLREARSASVHVSFTEEDRQRLSL
jgi:hypothetical protein